MATGEAQFTSAMMETVIPTGHLDPTGDPIDLTPAMQRIAGTPSHQLDLEVINGSFNPLKRVIGLFEDPGEMYQGKALVPTRDLFRGAAQQSGADLASLPALLAALPEITTYFSAAHQFAIGGEGQPGNRVAFYGQERGHKNIDLLTQEVAKQQMRLVKVIVHFNTEAQGGTPEEIVNDGVAGATHAGGFSAGWRDGQPSCIKSDWPADYGRLDDSHEIYNAHLIAIDYQAGTEQQVPDTTLAAWKTNADMIDAFAGMVVPFSNEDLDPRYRDYRFNPLEVHDNESAGEIMRDLADLDRDMLLRKHGAFYCAEGQYSVASMGWKENCLLKESAFGDTRLGKLIDEFNNAAGLTRNADGQITNPEVGWQHLLNRGLISGNQHWALNNTDRTSVALQWIAEDVRGAEAYGCKNAEGMIAQPMSVATMAWALLRTYMPREGLAKAIATDLVKAYEAGDTAVQAGLTALLGGNAPTAPEGQRALAALCLQAASGLLLEIFASEDFRNRLLHQAGFEEITNDADRAKVMQLYQEFVDVLRAADITDQGSLDAAVAAIDKKFKTLVVERNDFDPLTGQTTGQRMRTMQYAAPQCISFWTQHPELFHGTGTLRYVATAQHSAQASANADTAPDPPETPSRPTQPK